MSSWTGIYEAATIKGFLKVQTEDEPCVWSAIRRHNPDAIISMGYRVNSKQGVRFRQWSPRALRDRLVRGQTLSERWLTERRPDEARKIIVRWPRACGIGR